MVVETLDRADEIVARWRRSADADNPAGPLYAGGRYAEADLLQKTGWPSGHCGTACSGSRTRYCC